MMTEQELREIETLIERLLKYEYWCGSSHRGSRDIHPAICDEAVNTIDILLAEVRRLRCELREVYSACAYATESGCEE